MGYFKWLFTRWYFWGLIVFSLFLNPSSDGFITGDPAWNFGRVLGAFMMHGILLSVIWIFVRKKYNQKEDIKWQKKNKEEEQE